MVASAAEPESHPALPRHVAVIMDGNGRWARRRALPRQAGHRAGIKPVRMTVEQCARRGVETLTLFAFSSENWRRPREEVSGLMSLFLDALEREIAELDGNGIRVRFIGDLDKLGTPLRHAVRAAELRTRANTRMTLVVAVAYGGRWDILQAARNLAADAAAGRVDPADIDEKLFANSLATAGLPSVDLLIRTGGEKRISNFLLWDIAYSEVCFSDLLWPDFDEAELTVAFDFYAKRQRRFGRTGEQIEAVRC
ncbi:MAG: di-trans,poly-cis-decaprenylcistransferase [Gammaproteobacteria bacterium]|nr:di-trans,poly-cis-decaprenylcistransferase [Gammaproteobacteria bacterium]